MKSIFGKSLIVLLTVTIATPVMAARTQTLRQRQTSNVPGATQQGSNSINSPLGNMNQSNTNQSALPDFSQLFEQIGGGMQSPQLPQSGQTGQLPDFSKLFEQLGGSQTPQLPTSGQNGSMFDLDKLFGQLGGQAPQLPTSNSPTMGELPDLSELFQNIGSNPTSQVPDISSLFPDLSSAIPDFSSMIPDISSIAPELSSMFPPEVASQFPALSGIDKVGECLNNQVNNVTPALDALFGAFQNAGQSQSGLTPEQQAAIDNFSGQNSASNFESCFADLIK